MQLDRHGEEQMQGMSHFWVNDLHASVQMILVSNKKIHDRQKTETQYSSQTLGTASYG